MIFKDGYFYDPAQTFGVVRITKGITLSPNIATVEVYAEQKGYTVTLPKARDTALQVLNVYLIAGDESVILKASSADAGIFTDITLASPGEFALLMSDGAQWRTLISS